MSTEWRPHCCSSLSPISDCFFKAPVAEDINYPASVNHVIYPRPRLRPPEGMKTEGGREREPRCKEERERGCIARGLQPLPTEQNGRRLPSSPPSLLSPSPPLRSRTNILLSLLGNLSAARFKTSQIGFPSFRAWWTRKWTNSFGRMIIRYPFLFFSLLSEKRVSSLSFRSWTLLLVPE